MVDHNRQTNSNLKFKHRFGKKIKKEKIQKLTNLASIFETDEEQLNSIVIDVKSIKKKSPRSKESSTTNASIFNSTKNQQINKEDERLILEDDSEDEGTQQDSKEEKGSSSDSSPTSGRIIVAEDQLINMQVIKQQLENLGDSVYDRCDFCHNGQEALEKATDCIKTAIQNSGSEQVQIQPISLVLLDF